MKRLFIRALTLLVIGSTVYYVYGIYLKTHVVIMHNSPSLGKEESNYDFISLLKGVRTGTYKTFYPNGQLREEFVIVNGRKNGPSKTYFDNGALRSEDNYKNDQLDGEIKRYEYATGFFFSVNQYKDGLLDGINKWYYPSGALKNDYHYFKGIKHGEARDFQEDGTLKQTITYTNNKLTGPSTSYFTDGTTVSSRLNYLDGKYDGEATWYFENGKISHLFHYKAGKRDGLCKIFYDSGVLLEEEEYLDDKLNGIAKTYYPDGQISRDAMFESGKSKGPDKRYYRSGQLESIKTYSQGQLDGAYTLYADNGVVLLDMMMVDGRIKKIFTDNILVNNTLDDILDWNNGPHFGSIVRFLLHSRQFDKLEQLAKMINSTAESRRLAYGYYFQSIAGYFGAVSIEVTPKEYFDLLDEWKAAYPDSLVQAISRIKALISVAWNFRGSNYASATTMASFKRFGETLLEAERLCQETLRLPEKSPHLFALWIWVSLGLDQPDRVTQHIFEQGIALDKTYFDLYEDRLVSLLPKWGGGKETVEEFIKISAEGLDDENSKELYAHLVNTLIHYEGRDFLVKFNLDQNQLLDSYYYYVSLYPDNKSIKNDYAWLTTQLQDKKRAAIAFQLIDQDDFEDDVWTYADFREARQWASSGETESVISDIHNAVKRGDMVALYLYLKNKGDINAIDNKKQTLLVTAINAHHLKLAEYLIDAGADINKADDYGQRPLHVASGWGHTAIVRQLLAKKATVNTPTKAKLTPLHKAAIGGYTAIGSMLLKADRSIIKQKAENGRSALLAACENAQTDFVRMLMDYKELDLAEADNDGYNCMHFAVYKGAEDLVKLLLKTDVDYLQQKNSKGETPLDAAVKANHTEIIRLLNESLPAPVAVPAAPTEAVIPAL